jgi:hypothetical protein
VYNVRVPHVVRSVLLTVAGALLGAVAAAAHHSFAAEYDAGKPATFSGRVTEVRWINPHVRFALEVIDAAGTTATWQFEMGAVNGLLRRGWSRDMLKPGDEVRVDGYLSRDGARLANARVVTLKDGRKMSGGTISDAPAN